MSRESARWDGDKLRDVVKAAPPGAAGPTEGGRGGGLSGLKSNLSITPI
jgi:hypothetical protein